MKRTLLLGCLIVVSGWMPADRAQALEAGAGAASQPLASCHTDLRLLNPITGWQVAWPQAWRSLASAPAAEQEAALKLWMQAGAALEKDIDALRRGAAAGEAAPEPVVRRVLQQVEELAATQDQAKAQPPSGADFDRRWQQLTERSIRPAVVRYATFLRTEYLPKASKRAGLPDVPDSRRCFAAAVAWWTTLNRTPDEIEHLGRRLMAETRRELAAAAGIDDADVPRLLDQLRQGEGEGRTTTDELLRISRDAIARADAALPRWFATKPEGPIVVEPMPKPLEASLPAAFYRPSAAAGAPAAYVINLSRPAERRLMAEVIAFHEALPGHHLNLSTAKGGQYNAGLGEGWAIYAEYLADEMALYSSPRDRMGMIAKHLWAASRLVVEPGLHLHGWSRDQAMEFMRKNTALPDAEIAIEVDRYIAMPGQSLAYMLGYEELRTLRAEAQRRLGSRFDIRAFHDVILRPGMRDLAAVRADVDRWIADVGGSVPR